MYSFSKDDEEEVRFIERYIQSGWVSGIVLLNAMENDKCISYLKSTNFPFVLIGTATDSDGVNWVDNDNVGAMFTAVNSLIKRGKRNIAFIGGSKQLRVTYDRFSGYKNALSTNNIPRDRNIELFCDNFSEKEGYSSMKKLLEVGSIDAVVTTDDLFAFGVLDALKECPGNNIMVTGFNNTPRSGYVTPTLTTVEINADELGENAARLLIDNLENKGQSARGVTVDTVFIERDSTSISIV